MNAFPTLWKRILQIRRLKTSCAPTTTFHAALDSNHAVTGTQIQN